jgi:hypothetical protein
VAGVVGCLRERKQGCGARRGIVGRHSRFRVEAQLLLGRVTIVSSCRPRPRVAVAFAVVFVSNIVKLAELFVSNIL